jgi:hypothetical protein
VRHQILKFAATSDGGLQIVATFEPSNLFHCGNLNLIVDGFVTLWLSADEHQQLEEVFESTGIDFVGVADCASPSLTVRHPWPQYKMCRNCLHHRSGQNMSMQKLSAHGLGVLTSRSMCRTRPCRVGPNAEPCLDWLGARWRTQDIYASITHLCLH